MLTTRLLTAVVLIPIVAWVVYLGGLPFLGLIALAATVAQIEFCTLAARRGFRVVHSFGIGLVWIYLLNGRYPTWGLLNHGPAVLLLLSLGWQVARYPRSEVGEWTTAIAGGLYVGLCGSYLIQLRALPGDGLWWTFITVAVTLLADSTAYAVGSIWGRRKLAPGLSSGKTVEGYVGAILLSALTGGLLGWIWSVQAAPGTAVTWGRGLVLGFLIATLAPLGDLAISMVKREAGVSNSSNLIPGHGGMLDRLDTVLVAAVIGHAYVTWFVN